MQARLTSNAAATRNASGKGDRDGLGRSVAMGVSGGGAHGRERQRVAESSRVAAGSARGPLDHASRQHDPCGEQRNWALRLPLGRVGGDQVGGGLVVHRDDGVVIRRFDRPDWGHRLPREVTQVNAQI